MKISFISQRSFTYVGHAIALQLKHKYKFNNFSAFVFLRTSYNFLKSQKDINYHSLVLDEDIHPLYRQEKLDLTYLQWLEKEYGIPNLWPYAAVDRVLMFNQMIREYPYNTPPFTHEEIMRIIQVKAKAVIEFLEKEKPDVLIYSVIGAVTTMLLYEIAKKKGIQTIAILPAYIRNRTVVSGRYDRFTSVEAKAQAILSVHNQERCAEARTYLKEFREKPQPYYAGIDPKNQAMSRWRQFKFLTPRNFWLWAQFYGRYVYRYFTEIDRHDYSYISPWYYLVDRVKRKLRNLRGTNDLYDSFTPQEDFAFYALQYEPEISSLLHAPFYANQLNLVRQIARSLPLHFKLYVKEHPQMVQYRPREYYQELKKIPNVKLIHPAIPSFAVLPHTKLIFTLTSTAGWEGIFLKKPVINFGEQFYNALSMVKKCVQIDQLPFLVKEQLENFTHNETELEIFVQALLEESVVVDLPYLWEQEQDSEKRYQGAEPIADLLVTKYLSSLK